MQNKLFIFFISFLMLSFVAISHAAIEKMPEPFQIVPQPQKIELLTDNGLAFGKLTNLKITGEFDRPVMGDILCLLSESYVSGSGMLTLKLDSFEITTESHEGYVLTIANGNVKIVARGEAGLFYGCQTLEQLLEDARDYDTPIPACKITDSPALSYRAVHFDVKHHLDHMNYYYKSIDRLARYKINAVIFEFEDKLRYQRQPLVGAPQAISIDEMAALTEYARERHIEISPLVQGLGHATFILKHQQYAHLREQHHNRWVFCPLHEATYQVLFDLYRDAIDATPGAKYLHIGGDEIGNIGLCPHCKPTAEKEGLLSLNLYWLKRVCEFAEAHGRIPIFWDDMPLKEADVYKGTHTIKMTQEEVAREWESGGQKLEKLIEEFPKNCIYMRWNYSIPDLPGNIKVLDWYLEHGLKAMAATAVQSGQAALFPRDDRGGGLSSKGTPAIRRFAQLSAEKKLEGILCTAWDDRSLHMETYWLGFIASAEYSWSPNKRPLGEFDLAYLHREYGATIPDYANLYGKLREAALFWEVALTREGNRMEQRNALLVLPGISHGLPPGETGVKQRQIDFTSHVIELPDLENPGSWRKIYQGRLDKAKTILAEYKNTSGLLSKLSINSKKNRYHWEVFTAINNFQVTAPKLLLALEEVDTADKKQQKNGFRKIHASLLEFDKAWGDLQKVYSKTRFISYPENYVADRYFHFASQREDLTWLIQVEELLHREIKQWLENMNTTLNKE